MSAWEMLDRLLATDPRDSGCAGTFLLIHAYAEIVVQGGDPAGDMPGITAHLASCPPCADDFRGLVLALREEVTPA